MKLPAVAIANNLEVSCFVACPEIAAEINSAKSQSPQDQQTNQQQ
jgi:hypothetical protein